MSRLRIASYAPLLSAVGLFGGVVAACVGEDAPSRVSTDTAADAGAIDDAQTDDPDGDAGVPDAGPDAAAPGDAGARGTVFVSTAKVDGAFAAGAASPTAAADAICANEALAAGLAGSYVAWLSYEDQNGTKFNAASRIGEMPYYLPAGEDGSAPMLFTAGRLDLVANGSDVPLARTATGAYVDQDENSAVAWAWRYERLGRPRCDVGAGRARSPQTGVTARAGSVADVDGLDGPWKSSVRREAAPLLLPEAVKACRGLRGARVARARRVAHARRVSVPTR